MTRDEMQALDRAIRSALDHATVVVGALRDAQEEARVAATYDAGPTPAAAQRINELIGRANTRSRRLTDALDNLCRLCRSRKDLTIDHIVPLSYGGGSEDANLQVLCRACNARKGAAPPCADDEYDRLEDDDRAA